MINEKTGVAHLRLECDVRLLDYLRELGHQDLLARGAVYVDGQRASIDRVVAKDCVLRLHTRPKRYAVPPGPLRARVVFENEDLVVLDKPSGLPTHPTLDNALENASALLGAEYGAKLLVTHRLDIPTEGLLILAKDARAQRLVNAEFAHARVTKLYEARSHALVGPGEYAHWLDPAAHVPRPIAAEARAGWWTCRLIVESSEKSGDEVRHRVRPLTGKTHQIRAQFAALGAPLLGDELYGGIASARFGLSCERLELRVGARAYVFARPAQGAIT